MVNTKKEIIYALIFLIVIAGVYFFVLSRPLLEDRIFTDTYRGGKTLFQQGDFTEAIIQFDKALEEANTKTEEALSRVNLGTSYLAINPAKGIALLKEVSLDETLPKRQRAYAVDYVLTHYNSKKDIHFAFDTIFIGEQWGAFSENIPRTSAGAGIAVLHAYEWSTTLDSTYTSEYRIAAWYAGEIKRGLLDEVTAQEYAVIVADRIERGDQAFTKALQGDGNSRTSQLGLGMNRKGLALEGLHVLGSADQQSVIDAYAQAINIYKNADSSDVVSKKSLLYTHYNLAAFLSRIPNFNEVEIREILEPTHTIISASFFTFLRNMTKPEFNESSTRKDIVRLGQIDPQFKNVLLELGWVESDFN